MFHSTMTIALVAALLPATIAAPTAMQKRFTGAVIRSGRTNTCLTLRGGVQIIDGSLLSVGDCATATKWDINPGSGSVIVTGTKFALDAGSPPGNNAVAKVWTSYPGLTQQTWYLTPDNRIAITGGNQCLDQGDNGPQTYQCTTGNTNQVWYVEGALGPVSSSAAPVSSSSASTNSTSAPSSASATSISSVISSSASANATSSAAPTTSASANSTVSVSSASASASASPSTTPPTPGSQIKWKANPSDCLSVTSTPGDGVPVSLQACRGPADANVGGQLFTHTSDGLIQLTGTSYCLDAGTNPSNGVGMKLWTCYSGLAQQTWQLPGTGLISTANNQCLNIDNSDYVRIQTWTCSQPDVNQGWVF